jgi:hypothetical protein
MITQIKKYLKQTLRTLTMSTTQDHFVEEKVLADKAQIEKLSLGKYTLKITPTFDLEWGVDTGPVKLVIYKDGKHVEDKFWMEHSVASIEAAFAYAKGLLGGVS